MATSESSSDPNPTVNAAGEFNPYAYLNIIRNPDGSITRDPTRYPNTSLTPDPNPHSPIIAKDIPINQSQNTWARVFVPRESPDPSSSAAVAAARLPLIVYFHGGGFIYGSAASTLYHDFCSAMSLHLPAVVVSVDHRLSPEHRLPAAYDDAVEALTWIRTTQRDWLKKFTDFTNCHVMGSSSGANIAYHAGLRLSTVDLAPLKIRGLILHHPFFSGTRRTGSDLRPENQNTLQVYDAMWDLALPVSADRDHEYCNPTVGGGSPLLEDISIGRLGWRVLLTGYEGDPLIDRMVEVVDVMDEKCVDVVAHFGKGGDHLIELKDRSKALALFMVLRDFISPPL